MSATGDLFSRSTAEPSTHADAELSGSQCCIAPGALLLKRYLDDDSFGSNFIDGLLADLDTVVAQAPFRKMQTPGGRLMSVAMTNCGSLGWVSDHQGYLYTRQDPDSGTSWPAMPERFLRLASRAAVEAGFLDFQPDACLINRYAAGARMGLHQDRDEHDFSQPIVSVSLGQTARFLFGGLARSDAVRRLALAHGDVVVWGGPSRLAFHGVEPPAPGYHPLLGATRINLTFRRAR